MTSLQKIVVFTIFLLILFLVGIDVYLFSKPVQPVVNPANVVPTSLAPTPKSDKITLDNISVYAADPKTVNNRFVSSLTDPETNVMTRGPITVLDKVKQSITISQTLESSLEIKIASSTGLIIPKAYTTSGQDEKYEAEAILPNLKIGDYVFVHCTEPSCQVANFIGLSVRP